MSTLTEIESAVEHLSREEQKELLRRLETRLRQNPDSSSTASSAEEWMDRLAALRAEISTGKNAAPSEQILEELREERC